MYTCVFQKTGPSAVPLGTDASTGGASDACQSVTNYMESPYLDVVDDKLLQSRFPQYTFPISDNTEIGL